MRCVAVLALVCSAALAACTTNTTGGDEQASGSESTATTTTKVDLADVEVSDNVGQVAEAQWEGEIPSDGAGFRRVVEGEGPGAVEGQVLRVHYTVFNAETKKRTGNTYDAEPSYVVLMPDVTVDTFVEGLMGAKKNSRTVFARASVEPAKDGAGAGETSSASPRVVVVDVLDVMPHQATGQDVEVPKTLPKVTLAENGAPTLRMPDADAPKELLVQPLKKGDGKPVKQGEHVTAMYLGAKWKGGEVFDTTWQDFSPRDLPVGVGKIIKGLDTALTGQTVGSQVLVVVPPSLGYGAEGREELGVTGTDTLVFVVDILGAY